MGVGDQRLGRFTSRKDLVRKAIEDLDTNELHYA